MTKHIPVLLEETIEGLHLKNGDIVVDATLGGGGHTKSMLRKVLPGGRVIALDTDAQAIKRFEEMSLQDEELEPAKQSGSLLVAKSNYSLLEEALVKTGNTQADAVLADLGFSSDQIESSERGLSFSMEGPLDMRLDTENGIPASDLVNTLAPEELARIFSRYGDESESLRIAKAISEQRKEKLITTTSELARLIEAVYPKGKQFRMKIHPATKVFQALRIAVNKEYEHLERFLPQAMKALKSGGRIAIITFHSGEDRIVKEFFRREAQGCVCPPEFPVCRCGKKPRLNIITKKPIIPTEEEITRNPRARSAKLRIAEKI